MTGLEVDCIVGIYPHERNTAQRLTVEFSLHLDTSQAAENEDLTSSIDYAAISAQVAFLLQSCRFMLLETAAEAITRYLLSAPGLGEKRAQIETVTLTLGKPDALPGRAIPWLTITRDKGREVFVEKKKWGTVDVLFETDDVGIYRLNIAPQEGIPLHEHRIMTESEMVLSRGLQCQCRPVPVGTVHRWPKGAAHRYDNPSRQWQSILCVDRPKFIPSDEVLVEGEPARVTPEAPWGHAQMNAGHDK